MIALLTNMAGVPPKLVGVAAHVCVHMDEHVHRLDTYK